MIFLTNVDDIVDYLKPENLMILFHNMYATL